MERLTLEVEWAGHPSVAPRDQLAAAQQPHWKPSPVAMWLPPETPATKVLLTGTPLAGGMYTVVGCQVTALGVSWRQPWTPRAHSVADQSWQPGDPSMSVKDHSGLAQARLRGCEGLQVLVMGRSRTLSLEAAATAIRRE